MEEKELLEQKLKISANLDLEGGDLLNMLQYLIFQVDQKRYGIDILEIHEILKPIEVTRMPNVSDYILGVINLRGNIIPVMDLQKKLFGEYTTLDEDTRIIVGNANGKHTGLLISKISEVARIQKEDMEASNMEEVTQQHISGVGRVLGKVFLVLNLVGLNDENP